VTQVNYATPTDIEKYGEYKFVRSEGDARPLYRFNGRIANEAHATFSPEPGRYHLYAGWFCPWSQRVTLEIALKGLESVISISYVDNSRDARGWAFREPYGPDPINGFALLRDAYEQTEPGFDGHISVPTLWDKKLGKIVSNDFKSIGIDVATAFDQYSNGYQTYPVTVADQIEELDALIGPAINQGVGAASQGNPEAISKLNETLAILDERLSTNTYLLGDALTEADIRLWVTLVRFDVKENATRSINAGLETFPHIWNYAKRLYALPAFKQTTDFHAFTTPGVTIPKWNVETEHDLATSHVKGN